VRYRLGDIIVSGLRPSKNTLLMPIRIAKLFWHGYKKIKARKLNVNLNKATSKSSHTSDEGHRSSNINVQNISNPNVNKSEKVQGIIKKLESTNVELPNESPLVSILIINRNGENHLKRLFKAIYDNSEYPNYEIIIVDNNSSDNSLSVIESYSN